jgi:hypothetical protein
MAAEVRGNHRDPGSARLAYRKTQSFFKRGLDTGEGVGKKRCDLVLMKICE